jgi:hypothetical protein
LGGVPLAVVRSDDPPPHSRGRHRCRWATSRSRHCDGHSGRATPTRGSPGEVFATLLLQPHLTVPRRRLQGMKIVRLLVIQQGLTHAVAPHRDETV